MFLLLRIFFILILFSHYALNLKKELRYQNWYRPWLVLLYILICLIFFRKFENSALASAFVSTAEAQHSFVYIVILGWIAIKFLLGIFKVNKRLDKYLAKTNVNRVLQAKTGYDNYLLWPYYKEQDDSISLRAGFKFFKIILWSAVIILFLGYIWTAWKWDYTNLVIPNSLSYLAMLFISEWIIYFKYKPLVAKKTDSVEQPKDTKSPFGSVFQRYINKERGFYNSILFGSINNNFDNTLQQLKDRQDYLNDNLQKVIRDGSDLIISSSSLSDTMPQIADLLFDTLKKGGNILLVADLPNYITFYESGNQILATGDAEVPAIRLFNKYLELILDHEIPSAQNLMDIGFFSKKDTSGLNKRMIITRLEDAVSRELIHSEWIKELDLMIVFQYDDIYVNNLDRKRQLSLWLGQKEKNFKTIFLSNYRAGGDEANTNIWVSTKDVPEVKMQNIQNSSVSYFINFAYEQSNKNLNKILIGNANEFDIAPGMELIVFPLMEDVQHIHFFEGHNLDYTQSKNKMENLQKSFHTDFDSFEFNYHAGVSQAKISKNVFINNLPFIIHPVGLPECGDYHFSVVFDIENNAPKMYNKYKHMGTKESFICVVSKPHLFREFFASNFDYFSASTIESLAPQISKSRINLCLQLLNLLINEPIEIQFIQSQLNAFSVSLGNQSIIEFINNLFNEYLHIDISKNAVLKSESKFVFRNGKYQEIHFLKMDAQKLEANEIFEYLQKVTVSDFNGNKILELPKYLLFQNFLPQQNIIIDGISYDYVRFDDQNHELILKTKPTDIFSFQKPKAVIEINHSEDINPIEKPEIKNVFVKGQQMEFSSHLQERLMEVHFEGYYKFTRLYHSTYANSETPAYIDLRNRTDVLEQSKRKYRTRYLHFKWQVAKNYQQNISELTTQIHILLFEFMPILFPYRYQYIQIASNNNLSPDARKLTPWIFPDNNFEYTKGDYIEFYIVEDSFADIGILDPIQSFFGKILLDLYKLLVWIAEPENEKGNQKKTKEDNNSILNPTFYKDKLDFLKYGLDSKNKFWNMELLTNFLSESRLFN